MCELCNTTKATIISTVKSNPDLLDHLSTSAKAIIIGDEAYFKANGRDRNEPGWERKEKMEQRFAKLIKKIFDRQLKDAMPQIEASLSSKAIGLEFEFTEEELSELFKLIQQAALEGIDIFREAVYDGFSDEFINYAAAKWAKEYSYEFIKVLGEHINGTTLEAVQSAISTFYEMPGTTIGEVVDSLPFNLNRATMIAVTEITRAYAESQMEAAKEMQRELPYLEYQKTWFTNNDDKVCPVCGPLDGVTVGLDESFPDGTMQPPAHPRCRCWLQWGTSLRD